MNLQALTSPELESILTAFTAMEDAYDLLVRVGVLHDGDNDDISISDIVNGILDELTRRRIEDAGYKFSEMVGRGEVDRYVRPDGQVGYAPPGAYGEGQL